MSSIIEHELGHVCFLAQIAKEVRVQLKDGVYVVQSRPAGIEIGGPQALISELLAGMCMEAAATQERIESYSDLVRKTEFGELDQGQIDELIDGRMANRATLDRLAVEITAGMIIIRKNYSSGLDAYRAALTEMGEGDEQLFRSTTVH